MSPERIEYEKQKPDMTQDRTSLQDVPNVVPACPAGLAFQKQDFLLADFTVDGFLSHTMSSGNDVGLERLRDDLGLYLKVRLYMALTSFLALLSFRIILETLLIALYSFGYIKCYDALLLHRYYEQL